MDPPAPAAGNPLPKVPLFASPKIDIEGTGLYHRTHFDKHAMDGGGTRTSEPLERVLLDGRIAANRRFTAVRRHPAIVAIGGHRRWIGIQRGIHLGKEAAINPVIAIQEQYS